MNFYQDDYPHTIDGSSYKYASELIDDVKIIRIDLPSDITNINWDKTSPDNIVNIDVVCGDYHHTVSVYMYDYNILRIYFDGCYMFVHMYKPNSIAKKYCRIRDIIETIATDILNEENQINPILGFKHLSFDNVTDEHIIFKGTDNDDDIQYKHTIPVAVLEHTKRVEYLHIIKIKKNATNILYAEHNIRPIKGYDCLSYNRIVGNSVVFDGVEYSFSRCMPNIKHTYTIPIDVVLDANRRDEYLQKIKDAVNKNIEFVYTYDI